MTAADLDETALQALKQLDPEGRKGLVTKVLKTFETSLARLEAEIETARAASDLQALSRAAHTLRSSSAAVGALELSAACKATEDFIREGRAGDVQPLLGALQHQVRRAAQAVNARLSKLEPSP